MSTSSPVISKAKADVLTRDIIFEKLSPAMLELAGKVTVVASE
jgi:hypothetical protein